MLLQFRCINIFEADILPLLLLKRCSNILRCLSRAVPYGKNVSFRIQDRARLVVHEPLFRGSFSSGIENVVNQWRGRGLFLERGALRISGDLPEVA